MSDDEGGGSTGLIVGMIIGGVVVVLLVAALGGVVFAVAAGLHTLLLGRALIGMGVAVCFMSSITVFALWFPLERLATLMGWMLLVGAIGAISATKPVELALRVIDWRTLFALLSGLAARAKDMAVRNK